MNQLDWDDLRVFLAYVRTGRIRAAAERLNLSHSTVGRRLDQMQTRAGARFFEGKTGDPNLTLAGKHVLETAERVETAINGLQRQTFGLDQKLEGPIIVTMIDALAVSPILELFDKFRKLHPLVEIRIDLSLLRANLDQREADLALRFGESPADHLIGRKILDTGRAIYGSRDYVEHHWPEPEKTMAGWINYSPDRSSDDWKQNVPYSDLPTHLRLEDMRGQLDACLAGMGIVFLPCFLCEFNKNLVRLSDPEYPKTQRLWIVRHADTSQNLRVRYLSDFLSSELRKLAPLMRGELMTTRKFTSDVL